MYLLTMEESNAMHSGVRNESPAPKVRTDASC